MNKTLHTIYRSKSSIFIVANEKYEEFNNLVEEANLLDALIGRLSFQNVHFYYLVRDLWFYLEIGDTEIVFNEENCEQAKFRYTILKQVILYLQTTKIKPHYFKEVFNTFFLAIILAEFLTNYYDVRSKYNKRLRQLVSNVVTNVNVLLPMEELEKVTSEEQFIKHQIDQLVNEINNGFILNKHVLFGKLKLAIQTWEHVLDIIGTIVGKDIFYALHVNEQLSIIDELYGDYNLVDISDIVYNLTNVLQLNELEQMLLHPIQTSNEESTKPMIICIGKTKRLEQFNHYVNSLILILTSFAKKHRRDLQIFYITNDEISHYLYKDGQFTYKEIIEWCQNYRSLQASSYTKVNIADVFYYQDIIPNESNIIFIVDNLLQAKHVDTNLLEVMKTTYNLKYINFIIGKTKQSQVYNYATKNVWVNIEQKANHFSTLIKNTEEF